MAAQYYYLVASFPGLAFSFPVDMGSSAFMAACEGQLAPADAAELSFLMAGRRDAVTSAFSRTWLDSDTQLRNAMVRERALHHDRDGTPYLREHAGFRMDVEAAVHDACSRANPAEREQALDRFRWNLADELSAADPVGLPGVLAYAIKLRINERWQALTDELGRERLEEALGVVGISSEEVEAWGGLAQM